MVRLAVVLAMVLLACATPLRAEDANPALAVDDEYFTLVQEAYAMPDGFDFKQVRRLYPYTSFYEPYIVDARKEFEDFHDRLRAEDSSVVQDVTGFMYHHFALPEAHTYAASFFRRAGMPKAQSFHNWAARGLLAAYRAAGDGTSRENAAHPLVLSEQYVMTRTVGETRNKRSEKIEGRVYDILEIQDDVTKQLHDMWFDVTVLHAKRER